MNDNFPSASHHNAFQHSKQPGKQETLKSFYKLLQSEKIIFQKINDVNFPHCQQQSAKLEVPKAWLSDFSIWPTAPAAAFHFLHRCSLIVAAYPEKEAKPGFRVINFASQSCPFGGCWKWEIPPFSDENESLHLARRAKSFHCRASSHCCHELLHKTEKRGEVRTLNYFGFICCRARKSPQRCMGFTLHLFALSLSFSSLALANYKFVN